MDIKKTFAAVVVALTLIAVAPPLLFSQEDDSLPRRIVKWSEAEQTAWLNSYLSDGMPQPFGDALARLVLNKSSITLPLLEKKSKKSFNPRLQTLCLQIRLLTRKKLLLEPPQ